jgi:hypothetical protein
MLLLLPISFLIVASLTIFLLDRFRPKFGTSWLIASTACIISWLTIFLLRLRLPTTLKILSWHQPELNLLGDFSLLLDYDSWPYALALITVTLAVILSDAARTRYDSTPQSWTASLVITALGLLALQSGTSLTLMGAWVLMDLLELFYLLRLKESQRFTFRITISYAGRMASILMLFLATSLGWGVRGVFDLTQIPQSAGFFFMLAAGLRLGVLPLNLPFLQEPTMRRGAGNIIRLAPVAVSLSLLARLPVDLVTPTLRVWMPLFQGLLAIAALYAAIRWLLAADEIEGRPFWIVGWAALAMASVINGAPQASLAWGIALILPGSLLFLYYPRVQRMNFLLYFGLIGLVGLPLTPMAAGWVGLVANGVNFWTFLFVLSHVLMVLGYLHRVLQPGGEAGALETWARLVYPLGLIIIIQAIMTLGLIGWPGSLSLGVWWLGLISNLLVVTVVILVWRFGISSSHFKLPTSSRMGEAFDWLLPRLELIFRLEWFFYFLWQIYRLLGKMIRFFSTVLEGEGGILWTVLLLVLLITILMGGGVN